MIYNTWQLGIPSKCDCDIWKGKHDKQKHGREILFASQMTAAVIRQQHRPLRKGLKHTAASDSAMKQRREQALLAEKTELF